jgi:hypothetical protein
MVVLMDFTVDGRLGVLVLGASYSLILDCGVDCLDMWLSMVWLRAEIDLPRGLWYHASHLCGGSSQLLPLLYPL